MAEKKRSLVEEALLQMKNLEGALTENAKGILASTMKEEIKELVKESISDDETDEMSEVKEKSYKKNGHDKMTEQEDEIEMDVEDEEMSPEMDDMDNDFEMEDSEMEDSEMEMDDEDMEMDDMSDDEFEVEDDETLLPLDLTMASDEEILKVYKAMGEDDGIIVRKDNDRISLKDENEDAEYEIHLESEEDMDDTEMEMSEEDDMEDDFDSDEVIYEIEIEDDEVEIEDDEMTEQEDAVEVEKTEAKEEWGSKKDEFRRRHGRKMGNVGGHYKDYEMEEGEKMEGEYKESSIRSFQNGRKLNKKPDNFPPKFKRPGVRNEAIEKEVKQLREKNEEYRKALNIFKEKLNEVAVFNSNLAYATRLFMEHSTSKQEKINILKRFDSVETIKESKNLYKTLKDELDTKETPMVTEGLTSKIQKPISKGSATNLIESKTYENPQFLRMKDLMSKIQK